MTEIMSPSTEGQIDKAVAKYRAMLTKASKDLPSKAVQTVLEMSELASAQSKLFVGIVEAHSKTIVRRATVDRTRSQNDALIATGRKLHLNESVVKTMPSARGDIEAIFVNFGRSVDCDKLDEELSKLGLELIVDPQGLAAINEDDPAFADDHQNGTQWKDTEGRYCYVIFRAWRGVGVGQSVRCWDGFWWFPCRRKLAL